MAEGGLGQGIAGLERQRAAGQVEDGRGVRRAILRPALAYVQAVPMRGPGQRLPSLAAAHPGPWVFCHTSGVYNRRPERADPVPAPRYISDPANPLSQEIRRLAQDGFDQVFAAGNGGQFCPHPLCGPGDTGPGQSLFGAACLHEVLTLGAVRADGIWIGYSSQGPGQPGFGGAPKPDLAAPSHFFQDADAHLVPSGTSTACGMAVGAGSPFAGWSSAELFERLGETAAQPLGLAAALKGF